MDNQRIVVYSGTRNVYEQMYVSLKSLLANTQVDMVLLFIEDDEFPYQLPENVKPMNVSGQEIFHADSPNYRNNWSYMELLRCSLGVMLPEEFHKVLWLDIDTIVNEDIGELFDIDLTDYYYAGVMEPKKCLGVFRYINVGVVMINLDLLRQNMKEIDIINYLNKYPLTWPGQDAINMHCQGYIKLLDSEFNSCGYTQPCIRPKVYHFAATPAEQYKQNWVYKKYEQMNFKFADAEEQADEEEHP